MRISNYAVCCLCFLLCIIAVLATSDFIVPPSTKGAAIYPAWAHAHWVWLAASKSTQASETSLVKDYLNYGIPVGALDVDSLWSTCTNDFQINTKKFPDMKRMVDEMHELGVRVILWATSVVNTDCDNFAEAKQKGYFLRGLDGKNTISWWHGVGSFIDYTNPDALQWWHSHLDRLLSIGVDGWKCDGTDPFIYEMIVALNYKNHIITAHQYSGMYYGDFYNYTRSVNSDALIMSRPVDSWKMIYLSFSPRYTVFSGWVGDQNPDFAGLKNALRNMFHSAWRRYVGFGSDIGGYRSGPAGDYGFGRTQELFLRWAQMSAFCSLMENGGNGEHRPWIFDQKMQLANNITLNTYRNFVFIHQALQSYLLSAGADAWDHNHSIMRPVASETILTPSSWDYFLGNDIFVAPIVEEAAAAPKRTIHFPAGNDYVDWWNKSMIYKGGSTISWNTTNLSIFPVFHRKGAILPIEDVVVGLDHHSASDALTFLIHYPTDSVPQHTTVRRYKGTSQDVSYRYERASRNMRIMASAHTRKMSFRITGVERIPSSIKAQTSVSNGLEDCERLSVDPDDMFDPERASNNNPFPADSRLPFLHIPGHLSSKRSVLFYFDAANRELEILVPDVSRGVVIEISDLKVVQ